MVSRYEDKEVGINATDRYKEIFRKRKVNYIRQFFTQELKHPTEEEIQNLSIIDHTWKEGDRFFKLAHQYYGDSTMWWVIAWFNRTPTESHADLGDTIHVPLPLERILEYYDL
jgi:nucleoid-associated protein YgaU